MIEQTGKPVEDITMDDIEALDGESDPLVATIQAVMANVASQGGTLAELYEQLEGAIDYFTSQLEYNYNPEFDARDIVGDNPGNLERPQLR